jgi:hypothetical protein
LYISKDNPIYGNSHASEYILISNLHPKPDRPRTTHTAFMDCHSCLAVSTVADSGPLGTLAAAQVVRRASVAEMDARAVRGALGAPGIAIRLAAKLPAAQVEALFRARPYCDPVRHSTI